MPERLSAERLAEIRGRADSLDALDTASMWWSNANAVDDLLEDHDALEAEVTWLEERRDLWITDATHWRAEHSRLQTRHDALEAEVARLRELILEMANNMEDEHHYFHEGEHGALASCNFCECAVTKKQVVQAKALRCLEVRNAT